MARLLHLECPWNGWCHPSSRRLLSFAPRPDIARKYAMLLGSIANRKA